MKIIDIEFAYGIFICFINGALLYTVARLRSVIIDRIECSARILSISLGLLMACVCVCLSDSHLAWFEAMLKNFEFTFAYWMAGVQIKQMPKYQTKVFCNLVRFFARYLLQWWHFFLHCTRTSTELFKSVSRQRTRRWAVALHFHAAAVFMIRNMMRYSVWNVWIVDYQEICNRMELFINTTCAHAKISNFFLAFAEAAVKNRVENLVCTRSMLMVQLKFHKPDRNIFRCSIFHSVCDECVYDFNCLF